MTVRQGVRAAPQIRSAVVVVALSSLSMGCAIHPLQQDATGVPTVAIVDHIRCETRLAIQDKAIDLLRGYGTPQAIALAARFASTRGEPWRVDPNIDLPDSKERAFYARYIGTGIAYDFTFDVTEDNKVGIVADPVRLITNGTVGIGLNGSSELNRNNSRHFIMSDTFNNLLQNPKLHCADTPPNFVYPIAGSVGMAELINTFVDLNEDKPLAVDSSSSRVFADTLTFTTTLTGSASPHVEIAPIGSNVGLASPSNFGASGQRLDKHMMIIGLAMEKKATGKAEVVAAPAFLGLPRARSALQKTSVSSGAEQRALDAVTQQRLDTFLDRFGTVLLR
ncbi:hypothetical protein QA640_04710 [Bradyrhizobium sp. CB82]|uniref:hypothetical protein n=1 Tax=Bradyrhizobium sp. CB82 TaxID=3039159 RepID=UPI0024B231C1|nr:hypothetical protein [Bradyrhizobium sp. CB82]WFU41813.1 hypothetical protein QA640_04710 [Bradyrhizobium sp. CB82]